MLITTSSARCYRNCPRQYKYRYIDGYKATFRRRYFEYGTYVHAHLDAFYKNEDVQNLDNLELSDEDFARANALVTAYKEHYEAYDKQTYLGFVTEEEFKVSELGYDLAGKVDLLMTDKENTRWVMEHKTASAMPEESMILHDPQVMNYLYAHPDAKGLIYNVLLKPKQRLKKDEVIFDFESRIKNEIQQEPEKYFKRIMILRENVNFYLLRERMDELSQQIEFSKEKNVWPQNPYACGRADDLCEFHDVCVGTCAIDASDKVKRSDKIHLELSRF